MMKRLVLLFLFSVTLAVTGSAQELNCNVTVADPTTKANNKQILRSMEQSIREFMSTRRWTNDVFDMHERIECNILFTISDVTGNNYSGTLQVKASRPAYNTTYNATTLYFVDRQISFDYIEFQSMDFQEGVYNSELTSILAYYAYLVLGYDYDSFSELGGTPYFQKAFNIANAAQASSSKGWSAMEKNDQNRYFLINDILDERYSLIRKAIYQYHRKGLDFMYENKEKGLTNILESLKMLKKAREVQLNILPLIVFFDAKSDELVDLFAQAPTTLKANARSLLSELDPANAGKYTSGLR